MKNGIVSVLILMFLIFGIVVLFLQLDVTDKYAADEAAVPLGKISVSAAVYADFSEDMQLEKSIAEDPNIGVMPKIYDYKTCVQTSASVESSYFDDCVFIGDSRMLGLIRYTDISPINYSSVGFSVAAYNSAKFVKVNGTNMTVHDALRENDTYKSVYIATGLNELGWQISKFIKSYSEMLDDVKSAAGDRPIYIQLILPMTAEFESSKKMNPYGLKNSDVSKFNESLTELAAEKKVYYLDCNSLFVLEDGTLDPNESSDGAHLTVAAYKKQLEYYKTHIVAD